MTSDPGEPAIEAKKTGRAGRNLPAAIGVGVALVAAVLGSLFFVKDVFVLVVALVLTGALIEISTAMRSAQVSIARVPVAIGGVAAMVTAYYGPLEYTLFLFGLTVLAVMLVRLPRGPDGFVRDVTASVFTLGYLFLMGTFVMQMVAREDGDWRIVAFIGCTIASDIGGYAAGVLFGKHPMAPTISPKKTWEGFTGSILAGMIIGTLVVTFALGAAWWIGVILGASCVVAGTLGDLCESLIKRDLGIKDMGNLLPGHGGIMDRLDSLIAVAPVAWVVMHVLI